MKKVMFKISKLLIVVLAISALIFTGCSCGKKSADKETTKNKNKGVAATVINEDGSVEYVDDIIKNDKKNNDSNSDEGDVKGSSGDEEDINDLVNSDDGKKSDSGKSDSKKSSSKKSGNKKSDSKNSSSNNSGSKKSSGKSSSGKNASGKKSSGSSSASSSDSKKSDSKKSDGKKKDSDKKSDDKKDDEKTTKKSNFDIEKSDNDSRFGPIIDGKRKK